MEVEGEGMNWEETLAGCNIFQVGASLKANREGRRVENRCGKSKHLENETLAQTDNFFSVNPRQAGIKAEHEVETEVEATTTLLPLIVLNPTYFMLSPHQMLKLVINNRTAAPPPPSLPPNWKFQVLRVFFLFLFGAFIPPSDHLRPKETSTTEPIAPTPHPPHPPQPWPPQASSPPSAPPSSTPSPSTPSSRPSNP